MLFDHLIQSVNTLQNSKYGKGNKKRLGIVQSALKQAEQLFVSENSSNPKTTKPNSLISFRNTEQYEQIPKILEEFMNDFEIQCLSCNGGTAKNYSLFSVTLLKIIKTLDANKRRGLLSAHALNTINKMFAKYPVKYSKRATKDPLALVFVITELAIDTEQNLSRPYEFDPIIPLQIAPLMQRYHMDYDNALMQIMSEFDKMPKFRLTVSVGESHREIVKKFLYHGIICLSLEDRIARAKNIIEKIIDEKNDSIALEHYNVLKLCYDDQELCPHLAEFAKTKNKPERRFANTILDEISKLN